MPGGPFRLPLLQVLQDPIHVRKAKQLGLEINTWTVNEPAYMELCCQLGVDRIITNYPDVAQNIVKKYK